jgi:hypothetical protein
MRKLKAVLLALAVLLIAAQFIRPGRVNPPSAPADAFEVVANPPPEARAVVDRACADCHSNHTTWPWYSKVAPASWLVVSDVNEARENLNFSEWGRMSPEKRLKALGDICREANSGDMPVWQYRIAHPSSRLTQSDVDALCMLSARAH